MAAFLSPSHAVKWGEGTKRMSMTLTFDEQLVSGPVRLRLPNMTAEKFWRFAKQNEGIKTEMTMDGDLIAYYPTGGGSGVSNIKLSRLLDEWAEADGTGVAFDSSTLFVLPEGARRSPDAAWLRKDRWETLSEEDQEKPVPFAPDFAAEILSPTDSLTETQAKMEEYRTNGVRLGWLIDRTNRVVYIYRPDRAVQILDDPATVPGDPELPGFNLDMSVVFPRRRTR